jgi:hypothetical protein
VDVVLSDQRKLKVLNHAARRIMIRKLPVREGVAA